MVRHTWCVEVLSVTTGVMLMAEVMRHAPDWSNTYHRVTMARNTHDVRGISV